MRIGYIRNENGNLVRKLVEEGEENNPEILYYVGATLGDHTWVDEDHIDDAKAALLENMLRTIREIAKSDRFWIVQNPDYWKAFSHPDNLVDSVPKKAKEGKTSVAWKINFPQMGGYYAWEEAERIEKELDECFSNAK